MATIVLVLHLLIAAALIFVVLMQRSEGGGLGMGSSSGGFMTGRGTANLLTRTTAALAGLFFVTSISLTLLAQGNRRPVSPLDAPSSISAPAPTTPAPASGAASPAAPAESKGGLLEGLEKGKAPLPAVPKSQ